MNWIFNRLNGPRVSDKLKFQNGRVVVMENNALRVVCLPAKGADIVSFYSKSHACECLLCPIREFTPVENNPECPNYISGSNNIWPEMFPVASAYGDYAGADQPFHGEAHMLPWRYDIIEDSAEKVIVRFRCRMQISPFEISRTMTLKANDPVLYIDEAVTNLSNMTLPLNWGHHPTFGQPFLSEHCRIYLPKGKLTDGDESNLQMKPPGSKSGAMFYLSEFTEGWYGIFNHQKNFGFGMNWDAKIFQVIWLWQSFNCSKGVAWFGREYAAAVEPVMSFPQSAAEPKKPDLYLIKANETLKTSLQAFIYDDPAKIRK
jgi:galactose mutarotase-like enzyme